MKPANSRATCLQPGQGREFEGGVRIPEPSAISKETCLFEQQRLTKAANARANCLQPGQGHGVSEASASWSSEITKATMAGQSGARLPAGSSLYSAACQAILHVVWLLHKGVCRALRLEGCVCCLWLLLVPLPCPGHAPCHQLGRQRARSAQAAGAGQVVLLGRTHPSLAQFAIAGRESLPPACKPICSSVTR